MKCENCNHKIEFNSFWNSWQHITKAGYNDNFCYNKGNVGIGYCGCKKPEPKLKKEKK